jgi:Mycotoxin biosynthesis protein UstYa
VVGTCSPNYTVLNLTYIAPAVFSHLLILSTSLTLNIFQIIGLLDLPASMGFNQVTVTAMESERLLDEGAKNLPFKRPRRCCTSCARVWCCVLLVCTGILIGLIPTIIYEIRTSLEPQSPIPPKVLTPTVPTIFAPDDRYIGSSVAAHRAWAHLLRNHETVYVPTPSAYGLERGFPPEFSSLHPTPGSAPDERFYRISNIHQLHCVNAVRIRYFELLENNPAPGYDPADWAAHVDHCFEYLRLSVMCGDTLMMEGGSPRGSPPEWRVDAWGNPLGWGNRRECIDWEALVDWQGDMAAEYNRTMT